MKTIVFYHSKTGSTKKYAEDIARQVAGEALPLKRGWVKKAEGAECLVFGGNVQAGNIQGLNEFLSEYERFEGIPIIVFSVGMALPSPEGRQDLISQNLLDMYHVRFYQVQGSFDLNKLDFFSKFMMKRTLKSIGERENASAAEKMIGDLVSKPLVIYDKEKIEKIVTVINGLSSGLYKA